MKNSMTQKKATWEDLTNLFLGAWIFLIPWTVGHTVPNSNMGGTVWNFWIVGTVVFFSAAYAIKNIKPWEEWTNLTAGVWLILSPWIFGYVGESGLLWSSILIGSTVSIVSALALPIAQKRQKQYL
jgi:hypothetical protein